MNAGLLADDYGTLYVRLMVRQMSILDSLESTVQSLCDHVTTEAKVKISLAEALFHHKERTKAAVAKMQEHVEATQLQTKKALMAFISEDEAPSGAAPAAAQASQPDWHPASAFVPTHVGDAPISQ